MGASYSSCSVSSLSLTPNSSHFTTHIFFPQQKSLNSVSYNFLDHRHFNTNTNISTSAKSSIIMTKEILDPHCIEDELLQKIAYEGLVYSALHGLVIGDRFSQKSGSVPAVGLVHAPFALLPKSFPESQWTQACEVAPIFNELVDRVSLDGKFLQESLSRTKKVDVFTSRLLDIHSKLLELNKVEEIRLGLHRSDYMLDEQTKLLLQIELNTISSSFAGLSCIVSELHRSLLRQFKQYLALDPERIPTNNAVDGFADALAKAWSEYNNPSFLNFLDTHEVSTIRKTLAEVDSQGELLPDGTLVVSGDPVAVVYFRAGYTPNDYPSESEWKARQLMELSSAVKCPSISYHLAGTKKIQQELAKPNVLERFLENKDDIAKLRRCFAGLWSLDDLEIIKDATERPDLYVMKPQREGGGNNIYGDDVRETLLRLQKDGSEEDAAYILMQRIFPTVSPSILMREGILHKDNAVSELGVFSTYLRNKSKVIINSQSGYLMRTKVASSDEGGVAAGFAVLDSIYLV
ncbi:ligase [Lithospermum erythrorhizon]|uniref:Glutathione synthetase n=1 Tax=Lithospermum erythrorhizon TaxID=34254 RepID=A0AAV3Q893_LITER